MNPSLKFPDWIHLSHVYLLAISDLEGNFIYVNQHFRERYAYLDKPFMGMHSRETVHPEDLPKYMATCQTCQKDPKAIIQIQFRSPLNLEGKYEWNYWEFSRYTNLEGRPQGILRMGYDITRLKESLSAILSKNLRLREIAQQQAHQVRAPLSSILGLVDLMISEPEQDKALAYLPYLKKASESLDQIIHEIIELTYDSSVHPESKHS